MLAYQIKEKTNPKTTNLQRHNSETLNLDVSRPWTTCVTYLLQLLRNFLHMYMYDQCCVKISKYSKNRKLVLQTPEKGRHSASHHVKAMYQISKYSLKKNLEKL